MPTRERKSPQRILWNETKSAVIYWLEARAVSAGGRGLLVEPHIVATPPETSPLLFGAAVQAEARWRGLGRAQFIYLVMDGGVLLWDLAEDRFARALKTLDFHHPRDHLWALSQMLDGESTQKESLAQTAAVLPAQRR